MEDKEKIYHSHFSKKFSMERQQKETVLSKFYVLEIQGVILLSKEKDKTYKLIDGLQRISTIKDYKKNPGKYIDSNEIDSEIIKEFIEEHCKYKNILFTQEYVYKKTPQIQESLKS